MSDRNYLITVVVLIIAFSAFSYYIGSKNQQNTNNITNQSGEPDFINLANPGNGIQEN